MTIDEVITMLNSEDCNLTTDRCLMKYKVRDCWKCILEEYTKTVYNKAIDDLIAKCENAKFAESDEIALSDIHTGVNSGLSMSIHFAEQLKVGGDNVQKK